jgi:hypothetical protein
MKYETFIKDVKELDLTDLTAPEAIELKTELQTALALLDKWFANLAEVFDRVEKSAKAGPTSGEKGRPPEPTRATPTRGEPSPVKAPPRRRGRPVPNLKVDFKKRPKPSPIAVGGADSAQAPQAAQIFQESYVSKDGPRPGAALPADHPRNFARPSSVTPEVDMSDFHEVEEAVAKNQLGKMFQ